LNKTHGEVPPEAARFFHVNAYEGMAGTVSSPGDPYRVRLSANSAQDLDETGAGV
jgi:hypothetical protein